MEVWYHDRHDFFVQYDPVDYHIWMAFPFPGPVSGIRFYKDFSPRRMRGYGWVKIGKF